MSRMMQTMALTLAGCGLLVSSGLWTDSARLHDTIRARVLAGLGAAPTSAESVRAALRGDPEFGRLLACFCRRTLATLRHPVHAEDAVQETFLKTWKGRPEMFLREHDEVLRYLREAARRNLLTLMHRAAPAPNGRRAADADLATLASPETSDPLAALAAQDLLEQLQQRLDPEERAALAERLAGAHSERELSAGIGASRYAASQLTESIRRKLAQLLEARPESAA